MVNIKELGQVLEDDTKDTVILTDEYRARANDLRALGLDRAAEELVRMANNMNDHYNTLVRVAQAVRERAVQLEAQVMVAYPEWPAIRWNINTNTYEVWDYETKQIYRATTQVEAVALFGRFGIGPSEFNNAHNQPYKWVRIWPRKTAEERAGEFFGLEEVR